MGFGSYDETEQEHQRFDSDDVDTEARIDTGHAEHEGRVRFEIDASNDELLETLSDIKDE